MSDPPLHAPSAPPTSPSEPPTSRPTPLDDPTRRATSVSARSLLVTGAAGFIGSHCVEALLARGHRVVGLDNFDDYYDPARKRSNLDEVRRAPRASAAFELVEGDIRDRALLARLCSGHAFDSIVHLAAMAGVRASVDQPALYYDVNLGGTLNLLEAARHHGKPLFVFASTSSVYGRSCPAPFVESAPADRPLAPYPASKRAAELLGHAYHHLHGLDFTALRFFTVYGPRGRPDMMPLKLLASIFRGLEVPLYDGGRALRDWTYVADIVDGVVNAAERRLGYEIINLGRGEPVRLGDFVACVERVAGAKARSVDAPMPDADMPETSADIAKARHLLGYAPEVDVETGVAQLVAWWRRTQA